MRGYLFDVEESSDRPHVISKNVTVHTEAHSRRDFTEQNRTERTLDSLRLGRLCGRCGCGGPSGPHALRARHRVSSSRSRRPDPHGLHTPAPISALSGVDCNGFVFGQFTASQRTVCDNSGCEHDTPGTCEGCGKSSHRIRWPLVRRDHVPRTWFGH